MIEVVQYKYADHWPIWVIVKDRAVMQCFLTESEAKQVIEKLTLA